MKERSEEEVLAAELSSCMLSHYKYCAAGVLLGLPLSIHKKSYWPVALAAVAGTAADFKEGSDNCKQHREALMACVARRKAAEAAKSQQVQPQPAGATAVENQAREGWPAGGQQGWPEKGWEQSFGSGSQEAGSSEGKAKW
eukprot:g8213.t1